MTWMYENTICVSNELLSRRSSSTDSDDSLALKTLSGLLVKLYIIGEKYQIRRLQNHAISACAKHWIENRPNLNVIPYVYRNTSSSDSPLRRLLIQSTKFTSEAENFRHSKKYLLLCPEFLNDLALSYPEDTGTVDSVKDPQDFVCRDYHVYPEEHKGPCVTRDYVVYDESKL
jgi:hypothetical protein